MDLIDREQALGCFWVYEDGDETEMPAYDRLQALPIVKEVDDCISRQDAIDAMSNALIRVFPEHENIAKKTIGVLPSAQPRMKGKWYYSTDTFEYTYALCSVCKWDSGELLEYAENQFKYCPHCGADMRGEEDETV